MIARKETDCEPIEGFEIEFEADGHVVLTPVDTGLLHVGGLPLTALAIASWDYGESSFCGTTDATGVVAWAVSR